LLSFTSHDVVQFGVNLLHLSSEARSGRPREIDRKKIIATTLAPPPKKLGAHWSSRLLAAHLRIDFATVAKAWREAGVKPWPVLYRLGGYSRPAWRAGPLSVAHGHYTSFASIECPGLLIKSVQHAAGHHDALDLVTSVELAGTHCVCSGVAAECHRHLVALGY
jgi:hypothetical protein